MNSIYYYIIGGNIINVKGVYNSYGFFFSGFINECYMQSYLIESSQITNIYELICFNSIG